MPIGRGRLPAGEKFWTELGRAGNSNAPVLERQVSILNLIFERLLTLADTVSLIKYEDICRSPVIERTLGRRSVRTVQVRRPSSRLNDLARCSDSIKSAINTKGDALRQIYPDCGT
jgi:hypothetical protein